MLNISDIQVDPKVKGSINYARARAAIEQVAKNRKQLRELKQIVIKHLDGVVEQGHETTQTVGGLKFHNLVKFPDGSKAKY